MTDKEQIIVDGCKVEECVNFRDEVSIDSTVLKNACSIGLWQRHYKNLEESCKMSCKCDENPNCKFKQFARKTQECEELKERKLKLELNENHNKNEIKKLKKRIRKDREFFKNKISSLTLARKQFLEALDHFNWQIAKVYDDILDIINKAKGEGNEE